MPSGTKRTNSAMGTGQIPPHNASCLLLCWTALANRTKTIHASTRMFAQMQYNWGKAIRDQSGRFAYREGVKDICVRRSQITSSLSSTLHSGILQPLKDPPPPLKLEYLSCQLILPFFFIAVTSRSPSPFFCTPLTRSMDKSQICPSQMFTQAPRCARRIAHICVDLCHTLTTQITCENRTPSRPKHTLTGTDIGLA